MEQERVNGVLLELLGTGPCRVQELGRVATQLVREQDPAASAREVRFGIDILESQGLVGKTGAGERQSFVLSQAAENS